MLLNYLRRLTAVGWAAVVVAPFVSHLAISTGHYANFAAVLATVETAMLAALALRRSRGRGRVLGGAAAAALVGLVAARLLWPEALGEAGLLAASGASHLIIYGSLLVLFGESLRAGRTDLITGLATRLRGGTLTPAMLLYTRGVTVAWCWFFGAQLAGSAALFAFAPRAAWSLFVNVLDGPSVVLMFVAEYALRRWRFRGYRHISPMDTIRSFRRGRAGQA